MALDPWEERQGSEGIWDGDPGHTIPPETRVACGDGQTGQIGKDQSQDGRPHPGRRVGQSESLGLRHHPEAPGRLPKEYQRLNTLAPKLCSSPFFRIQPTLLKLFFRPIFCPFALSGLCSLTSSFTLIYW